MQLDCEIKYLFLLQGVNMTQRYYVCSMLLVSVYLNLYFLIRYTHLCEIWQLVCYTGIACGTATRDRCLEFPSRSGFGR